MSILNCWLVPRKLQNWLLNQKVITENWYFSERSAYLKRKELRLWFGLLAVFRLSILNTSLLFSNTILINNQLGVILSGGPYSVYENGSPHVDPAVWDLNVPVLGICYGLQVIWLYKPLLTHFYRKYLTLKEVKWKLVKKKNLGMQILPFQRPILSFSKISEKKFLFGWVMAIK